MAFCKIKVEGVVWVPEENDGRADDRGSVMHRLETIFPAQPESLGLSIEVERGGSLDKEIAKLKCDGCGAVGAMCMISSDGDDGRMDDFGTVCGAEFGLYCAGCAGE